MRCHPARWLWGLIPIAMLSWLAVHVESDAIERDLERRSGAALSVAGFDWASVVFSGRDGLLVGRPADARERDDAVALVRNVWGVRVVETRDSTAVPAAIPSVPIAERAAPRHVLHDVVPAAVSLETRGHTPLESRASGAPLLTAEAPRIKVQALEESIADSTGADPAPALPDLTPVSAPAPLLPDRRAPVEPTAEPPTVAAPLAPPAPEASHVAPTNAAPQPAAAEAPTVIAAPAPPVPEAKATMPEGPHAPEPTTAATPLLPATAAPAPPLPAPKATTAAPAPPTPQRKTAAVQPAPSAAAAPPQRKPPPGPTGHAATPPGPAHRFETAALPQSNIAGDSACLGDVRGAAQQVEVHFARGHATLDGTGKALIDRLIGTLNACPEAALSIAGHADATGHPRRNLALSRRRARGVAAYMIDKGIDAGRLAAVGYGETRPVAPNDTRANRARNRRIEVVITARSAPTPPMPVRKQGTQNGLSRR